MKILILVTVLFINSVFGQKDPNYAEGHNTIVHLFEWKYTDIAKECEDFLGPKGFGAVQISPSNEHVVVTTPSRPWWERYLPVSYILQTRSGTEEEMADMIKRCNAVGVRVYADVNFNHMSGIPGIGTAGSEYDYENKSYPAVPYTAADFRGGCIVNDTYLATNVKDCEIEGTKDLDQMQANVRVQAVEYMDRLVVMGIAGFRIDSAKYMWPVPVRQICGSVNDINPDFGLPERTRPFFYQDVNDLDNGAVSKTQYVEFAPVEHYLYGDQLGDAIRTSMGFLRNWGDDLGLDTNDSVVFINNFKTTRDGSENTLTFTKDSRLYQIALAFMIGHQYGISHVTSSYEFTDVDAGPPQDADGNILGPDIKDGVCSNGWVCEHRWPYVYKMVEFREATLGAEFTSWWSSDQAMAFGRGDRGYAVFSNGALVNRTMYTDLQPGTYCDIFTGGVVDGKCGGKTFEVANGFIDIVMPEDDEIGVIALHVNAKL